ncbi:MAG: NmrA family NAD(P)-binding protein [Bacteroidota bacterium]
MERKIIALFGATGALGLKIAKEIIGQGAEVRAVVRATSSRTDLEKLGVTDFVAGDMMDSASLKIALAKTPKADALVASAAGYTAHTKGDSPATDTEGYRNLVDASKHAAIPRFVLISILECDKAPEVPHFYHKHLTEKHLKEIGQPFIALRPGAFLDQAKDFVLPKLEKGIFPAFVPGVSMGMIYTPDLARYAAMAAISLPESALGEAVDVGWNQPVSGDDLAAAFSKVLGKKLVAKPAFPAFVVTVVLPVVGLFNTSVKDTLAMIKWIKTGIYKSKNTQRQKELFSDLPTVEEAVRRYCKDRKLI